jgi:hypothetical protein
LISLHNAAGDTIDEEDDETNDGNSNGKINRKSTLNHISENTAEKRWKLEDEFVDDDEIKLGGDMRGENGILKFDKDGEDNNEDFELSCWIGKANRKAKTLNKIQFAYEFFTSHTLI